MFPWYASLYAFVFFGGAGLGFLALVGLDGLLRGRWREKFHQGGWNPLCHLAKMTTREGNSILQAETTTSEGNWSPMGGNFWGCHEDFENNRTNFKRLNAGTGTCWSPQNTKTPEKHKSVFILKILFACLFPTSKPTKHPFSVHLFRRLGVRWSQHFGMCCMSWTRRTERFFKSARWVGKHTGDSTWTPPKGVVLLVSCTKKPLRTPQNKTLWVVLA